MTRVGTTETALPVTKLEDPAGARVLGSGRRIEGQSSASLFDFRHRLILVCVISRSGDGGGGQNPGNNLHISGLSHKVDTRDLEAAFAKIGRVRKRQLHLALPLFLMVDAV
jgi:hypothetical protein